MIQDGKLRQKSLWAMPEQEALPAETLRQLPE